MNYKTLLVHLDASRQARARLDVALSLARRFDAHLIGLFALFVPNPRGFYVMAGSADYYEAHRQTREELSGQMEQLFRSELARANVDGEWMAGTGNAEDTTVRVARYADLVVVGQGDPADPEAFVGENFAANVVMSCGRPVLVMPYGAQPGPFGRHVLVAWDDRREAARAVHDALPLLARAERITVIHASPAGRLTARPDPAAEVVAALARHDVNAQVALIPDNGDARAALLSYGADAGYDLLVAGAYGHARWQERVLGGVSQTLFESMTVPVLMSH